jgi:hypothetical protein
MATPSKEGDELKGSVSTERIKGLWKTAQDFLEKTTPHYMGIPHIMVQSGMEIFELRAVWDNDKLESLTVASWDLSLSGSPQKLDRQARISYQDDEYLHWAHYGAVDDYWINRVEVALNELAENVSP